MRQLFTFLLPLILLSASLSTVAAQDLDMKGEVIQVALNAPAFVKFHGKVDCSDLSEPAYDMTIRDATNTLIITARKANAAPVSLHICEGGRTHFFRVELVQAIADPNHQMYDYSSLKKVRKIARTYKEQSEKKDNGNNAAFAAQAVATPVPEQGTATIVSNKPPVRDQPVTDNAAKNYNVGGISINKEEFQKKAVNKTNKLGEYLKILCDKGRLPEEKDKTIDQALNLFVSDTALVQVSSLDNPVKVTRKIRDYLKRFKLLKFEKVDIEWNKIQYVSDLVAGTDGIYRGVVTFEQTFTAYNDGKVVYSDITEKNIEVVLMTYKSSVEGKTRTFWDVLLSDMSVVDTRAVTR